MKLLDKEHAKKSIKPAILAVLSQVPVVAAFSTFYSEFVDSNWQEKQEKVQTEIIDRFSKLDEQFEQKIREKSNFASILGTVYQDALTDIEENKIPVYVNSLINAINSENIGNTKIHIFLNFLKEFTLLHIKTLRFFSAMKGSHYKNELNLVSIRSKEDMFIKIIKDAIQEDINDIDLLNSILNDLHIKGLLTISKLSDISLNSLKQPNGIYTKFTTDLGDEFLKFIQEH